MAEEAPEERWLSRFSPRAATFLADGGGAVMHTPFSAFLDLFGSSWRAGSVFAWRTIRALARCEMKLGKYHRSPWRMLHTFRGSLKPKWSPVMSGFLDSIFLVSKTLRSTEIVQECLDQYYKT